MVAGARLPGRRPRHVAGQIVTVLPVTATTPAEHGLLVVSNTGLPDQELPPPDKPRREGPAQIVGQPVDPDQLG